MSRAEDLAAERVALAARVAAAHRRGEPATTSANDHARVREITAELDAIAYSDHLSRLRHEVASALVQGVDARRVLERRAVV